jgi:lysophospholipase L1-like esterase
MTILVLVGARRRLLAAVLGLCAAGLAVGLPAGAAARAGSGAAPVTSGSAYLALGDSVTFGYQESGVTPAPNYRNAASFPGYPEQIGAELHLKVVNAACPGETSSSLINASAVSNGCENTVGKPGGYLTAFPLHVHYKGSQLAYGLGYLHAHHNVRLVSLMIGANDYFVCVASTKDSCTSSAERKAVLSKISANVRQILSAVRKAGYTGQLAVVNYYSLNYSSAATNALSASLNKAVDSAAKPFGVEVGDGFAEFKAATMRFGGQLCAAALLTNLGAPGKCGIHPSYAGQALLAQALEKAIKL